MRIKLKFISSQQISLPLDDNSLRNYFISFIKKTFECNSVEFYESIFNKKQFKPYVFSIWYGSEFKLKRVGPQISFIFSSGDPTVIMRFWNGLLSLKEKNKSYICFNSTKFDLDGIELIKSPKIYKKEIIVKTIGISILTNPNSTPKEFGKWYLVPKRESLDLFNEILTFRTKQRYEFLLNEKLPCEVKLDLIDEPIRECIIPHYKGYLKGFKGKFVLKSSPEVLQFLYDFGLGVRTGQGFGLFEVIRQL